MKDHAQVEELISVRALGGLDADDRLALDRAVSEHGPDCEECRLLEDEYAEVAGRLAFALAPAEIPEGMENELLAMATGAEPGASGAPTAATMTAARRAKRASGPGRERWTGWWRGIAAAAAALALFVGGWAVGGTTGDGGFDLVRATIVPFEGEPAAGRLAIAYQPGERGAVLFGAELPDPGEGRVYELWMIQGEELVAGACLRPSANGTVATYLDAELGTTDAMAVTEEPAVCPDQPTTAPFLTADLAGAETA